jgi:hypothetical protein
MMLHAMDELRNTTSEAELAERLGAFLGLETAAPEPVVRRAIVDDRFCRYLLASRGRPGMLKVLFADPANQPYAGEAAVEAEAIAAEPAVASHAAPDAAPGAAAERSSLSLIMKAGAAVAKWGASGFARVDDATFDARLGACQRCDQLVAPPDKLLYKVRLAGRSDQRVCNACGCPAASKAKLASEHCPLADPANPSVNRWGEPRAQDA